MIATHNIKVNGMWIRAGEQYGEPEAKQKAEKVAEPVAAEEPNAEEPKAEKPKTASRRKTTK